MLSSEPKWVAMYTQPRMEKKAQNNLIEAGYEVYLPLRRELHTWSDRKKWVDVPLLKSYIFAKITKVQVSKVLEVQGIVALVSFRQNVATIPETEIQMMKDFLASEYDIQVQTLERLKRGMRVRINSGALAGREGMLVSDCEDGNFAVEISGISMAMVIHVDKDLMDVVEDEAPKKQVKKRKYIIR